VSHASKLLLLSCLACAFACSVPSIEDLNDKRPIERCSEEHKTCPPGSLCIADRCTRLEDLACQPGTRVACGLDKGECSPGTQLCSADGLLGACEGAVAPVLEKCDNKDNDCDGVEDNWGGSVVLTREHDLSTPAAAVAVRRAPDGTQDMLLTLMAENGSLVASTLAPDGSWKPGKKFTHPQMSFKLPALVAQGDTVAAAWLGVRAPVGTESATYTVYLAMLNGSGAPTNDQVLEIPHGSTTAEPDQLKLAINRSHVLVLIKTPNESVVVTVSRNLDVGSRKGPFRLGKVHAGRWFHAMPGGLGDRFLVAYEDSYTSSTNGFVINNNLTATVSNDGVISVPYVINTKSSLSHSPFILPLQGDASEYSVYYAENGFDTASPKASRISFTRCGAIGCDTPLSFARFEHEVVRMHLAVPPGAPKPEMALFRWQDARLDPPSLTAVTFTDKSEWRTELRPQGQPPFFESLVVMPDSTRYLIYNQPPPPPSSVSSLAVGFAVTEAHVLPFCSSP
jgi:hypothetical protein